MDGAPFILEHIDIPLNKIELDEQNPRIQYRLALGKGSKTLEEVILAMPDLIEGQYKQPVRIIAFNTAKGWSRDVSAEFADEIAQLCGTDG